MTMVDEPDRPEDVSSMMEQLWGPRSQPPAGVPAVVAPRPAAAEPSQRDWQGVQRRLGELEARIEQLQAALDHQAAQTATALARANEAGEAVAGIARITKIWTGRRKA
jgi:hypothetical protein